MGTDTLTPPPPPPPCTTHSWDAEEVQKSIFNETSEAVEWLIKNDLLREGQPNPTLDTLADILLETADDNNKSRTYLENMIRATSSLLSHYHEANYLGLDQSNPIEQTNLDDPVSIDNDKVITEMKHMLQDIEDKMEYKIDKAIKAIEDTAKELRHTPANTPNPQSYSQTLMRPPPPLSHFHTHC